MNQDLERAKLKARQKAAELKRKARQDVRTAGRRARNIDRDDVRRAASRVAPAESTSPTDDGQTTEEIGERAYQTAQAPPILGASLSPEPPGDAMWGFASRGGMVDEGLIAGGDGRQPEAERADDGPTFEAFVTGDGGDGEPEDSDALGFDDGFIGGGL